MYIGELDGDYCKEDIFVNLAGNDQEKAMGKYLFCGADHKLNIVVFAIGIISGPLQLPSHKKHHDLSIKLKSSMIQK